MTTLSIPMAALACFVAVQGAHADPFLDRETVTTAFPMPSTTGNLDLAQGAVSCPDEAVLITGGAWVLSENNAIPPYVSLVSSHPNGNGWTAQARETTDNPALGLSVNLMVTVVCGYTHRSAGPHIQIVTTNVALNRVPNYPDSVQGSVACPSGKTMISGGAKVFSGSNLVPEGVSLMTSKASGNGWTATAREFAEVPYSEAQLSVRAVCADAGSGIGAPQIVSSTTILPDDPTYLDVGFGSASCPSGKSRIGGGADIMASNGAIPPYVTLMTSEPTGTNGWNAVARETQSVTRAPLTVELFTTANCAALSGVSGLQVVTKTYSLPDQMGITDAVTGAVYCPSGKSMIGGGARILASNNAIPPYVALLASAPSSNGWLGVARETADTPRGSIPSQMTVSAVCAILPP